MNKFGKYIMVALIFVGISACTNDSDGLQTIEQTEVSRSSDLISEEVTLSTEGTLSSALTKDPTTLQKLKITGPINAADVEYWKTTLTELVEIDLGEAVPTQTEGVYYTDIDGNTLELYDNCVGSHMFSYMTKLEKIVFPKTTTSIGWGACLGCTSLASADIPASVTFIQSEAFNSCGFTSVLVPETVTEVDGGIFRNNPNLESATFLAKREDVPWCTFESCSKLTKVVLGDKIKVLGDYAFQYCSSLKDYTQFDQITKLGHYTFYGNAFESVDLSNVLEMSETFRDCKSLTTVILPPSMKSTAAWSFFGCDALANITWPTALETISDGTFGGAAFEELEIPSTVTTIGYAAFEYSKLRTLIVPASVKIVGGSIINSCSNLSALVWNSTAPVDDPWGVNSDCYLFIPNSDVVVGPNWKNIVVGGVAEIVELCANGDRTNSGLAYSIPVPFKAKKITYTRYFERSTIPGESSGWYTIVLPFTPTMIEHETKGVVAPFNSEVEGAKPFWLRELTAEGFVDKTTMEPNKAYIIAMPNHHSYVDEYCLNGKIIFSAENVELAATTEKLTPSVGPEYSLQPTYNFVERGVDIYALNVDYGVDGYHHGSIFVRNTSNVYAFEAYATLAGRAARSAFDVNTNSKASRTPYTPNNTGIPKIGDM